MFLFSKKYKTPLSTYTDSYRPPSSVKKTFQKKTSQQWKENNFVTQGLTVPPEQNLGTQDQSKQMITEATQTYYRNTIDPPAWRPEKYWLERSEEKYNPVFVNEEKYINWRTGPYNDPAWNKHSSYLPLLPKETRMENFLHSIPVPYPLRPTYLNQSEKEVLYRLPAYTVRGTEPFQDYYSPCSGCHCSLRGMGYCADRIPATKRHLHPVEERALRWDSSHFMTTEGVQRGSYIIHPEFTSEAYSALRRW